MNWDAFFTVVLIHTLGVTSPGPDFALIIRNSLGASRQHGVYTGLGFAAGVLIHVSYCIAGLAVLIVHSTWLFTIIKVVGGLYLIYMGVRSLIDKSKAEKNDNTPLLKFSHWQAFRQGFLCNLLNPKATLTFLAIFVLVVKPTTPLWQQLIYGVEMIIATFAWFSFIARAATHPKSIKKLQRFQHHIVRVMGVVLIVFGVVLIGTHAP